MKNLKKQPNENQNIINNKVKVNEKSRRKNVKKKDFLKNEYYHNYIH